MKVVRIGTTRRQQLLTTDSYVLVDVARSRTDGSVRGALRVGLRAPASVRRSVSDDPYGLPAAEAVEAAAEFGRRARLPEIFVYDPNDLLPSEEKRR